MNDVEFIFDKEFNFIESALYDDSIEDINTKKAAEMFYYYLYLKENSRVNSPI